MSIKSSEIEQVAVALLSKSDEASYRSSASRFYYSGWHLMEDTIANSKTLAVPHYKDTKGGIHKAFFEGLASKGKVARICAFKMMAMHKLRVVADYKLNEDFAKSQALEVKNLLQDLKEHSIKM